ncbi:MAG: hypothetical protein KME15_03440 [Drouetiella hepatica Uher 2000/2452]|jgi:hypothetical protein|uniref:Glucose-inhibited division protein A n=1 Tax=Drouetiella hepatica Uher 2000/2452 TaxID=904376 RepID=A0A951Q6W1_9CYAN|nr:hypothetical protein [Drouetiella hepatica Uher 2000/2452]
MDRQKFVAIVTGAIAVLISIAYLLIVQILDFRGEMLPAPMDLSSFFVNAIALLSPSLSIPAVG